MTLLVALQGKDGLILAADSRGTFGDVRGTTAQNDNLEKAHILAPHVGVLAAGAGEIAAIIIDEAQQQIATRRLDGATPVMEHLRELTRLKYNDWFPSVAPIPAQGLAAMGQVAVRPGVEFIVVGYEMDEDRQPRLYHLQSHTDFSPMLADYGFAVSGVAQYALYLLNRLYQPDRDVEELTALAVYVITETATQDGKVGGPVRVMTIRPDEGAQVMDRGEVDTIMVDNERRSLTLRNSFYATRGPNGDHQDEEPGTGSDLSGDPADG